MTMAEFMLGVAGSEALISSCDCEMGDVKYEEIARSTRTASGALKRDVVAVKRVFPFAYSWLPGKAARVQDGGMGRDELLALYNASAELSFHLPREDAVAEDVTVRFRSFSSKMILRDSGWGWVWAVSFELEEV